MNHQRLRELLPKLRSTKLKTTNMETNTKRWLCISNSNRQLKHHGHKRISVNKRHFNNNKLKNKKNSKVRLTVSDKAYSQHRHKTSIRYPCNLLWHSRTSASEAATSPKIHWALHNKAGSNPLPTKTQMMKI